MAEANVAPSPPGPSTVYDKDGNEKVVTWSVDAREMVASGRWFYAAPAKVVEPKAEKVDQKSATLSLPGK